MAKFFQAEEVRLSNGIPVIFQHSEGMVSAVYWWNNVGSADEKPNQAGFAHFLEHMLFKDAAAKDTGKASTGQMARTIEGLGGDINAYTSFDQTVYHVTCAEQHWERVLNTFGTIAKPQRFLKQDFEREREVILEELKKNQDSPSRQLYESLFRTTYAKSSYGRPIIGFESVLKKAKVQDLEKFYKGHYVPERMGVIMVGPLTEARKKKLLTILEKRFGKQTIPARKAEKDVRTREPALRAKPKFEIRSFDVQNPSFVFGFRGPHLTHEDSPILDVIASVLGMGEMGRLYRKLFYEKSLVTDVSSSFYSLRDEGLLFLHADLEKMEQLLPAVEQTFETVARIKEEGPTQEELERIIVNIESEKLYASQSADGLAGRIGILRFMLGNLEYDAEYLEQLKHVTADRIKEVANKYLDYGRMSGALMVPQSDAKQAKVEAFHDLAKKYFPPTPKSKSTKAAKKSEPRKGPQVHRLKSGVKVVYLHRPFSHAFSVQGSVLGGLRLEGEQDWGASNLLAATWTKGTLEQAALDIARQTEGRAASIDGFSGKNSIGLQMTGLARDWTKLSPLFTEVLLQPSFPEDEVTHSRRVAEEGIRSIEDHSAQLCIRLFQETLFQEHPYGKSVLGSLDSIQRINSERLKAIHQRWMRPDRLCLSVAGHVEPDQFWAWVEDLESRLTQSTDGLSTNNVDDEKTLTAPRWIERNLGREQVHLMVGSLGLRQNAPDRFAVRLMQMILGGQGGRLFVELREKKSLAYTVAPLSFEGMERGYVGTYIASAPEKREEALNGISLVLEKLAKKGPSASELKRAKEFYMGQRAMELQGDPALSTHYGLQLMYGKDPEKEEARVTKGVSSVQVKDVQKACEKYLVKPCTVISTVG